MRSSEPPSAGRLTDDLPAASGDGPSNAKFVVIDPIMAFISAGIQTHNDASTQRALSPLTALYRGGGCIAFGGAARSVLLLAQDPNDNDTLVLAQVKSNLASREVSSLRLRVEGWRHDTSIPTIRWGGISNLSADDLLQDAEGHSEAPARNDAERFLRELLVPGAVVRCDGLGAREQEG